MKRQRIPVSGHFTTQVYNRVPFDIVEYEDGTKECWVRYRGGRLFVQLTGENACWMAFRFEPKHGNAIVVGARLHRGKEEWRPNYLFR